MYNLCLLQMSLATFRSKLETRGEGAQAGNVFLPCLSHMPTYPNSHCSLTFNLVKTWYNLVKWAQSYSGQLCLCLPANMEITVIVAKVSQSFCFL